MYDKKSFFICRQVRSRILKKHKAYLTEGGREDKSLDLFDGFDGGVYLAEMALFDTRTWIRSLCPKLSELQTSSDVIRT